MQKESAQIFFHHIDYYFHNEVLVLKPTGERGNERVKRGHLNERVILRNYPPEKIDKNYDSAPI